MKKLTEYFKAERGRMSRLAEALGISYGAVSNWDKVPADRVVDIERITGISRADLRPDLFKGFRSEKAA